MSMISMPVSVSHRHARYSNVVVTPRLRARQFGSDPRRSDPHLPTDKEVPMSPERFDLIVIGAGSAARDAAGKAKREYGASVAMIERERWGGSCPNVACRPTKAYLAAAELLHDLRYEAANRGIEVGAATIDLKRVRAWKDSIRRDQRSWAELLASQYTTVRGGATLDAR